MCARCCEAALLIGAVWPRPHRGGASPALDRRAHRTGVNCLLASGKSEVAARGPLHAIERRSAPTTTTQARGDPQRHHLHRRCGPQALTYKNSLQAPAPKTRHATLARRARNRFGYDRSGSGFNAGCRGHLCGLRCRRNKRHFITSMTNAASLIRRSMRRRNRNSKQGVQPSTGKDR
jgi:hypothetical protein